MGGELCGDNGDGADGLESEEGSGDVAASSGAGGLEIGVTVVGKVIVRADQSINELSVVSQLRLKTAVDGESSLVM